MIQDDGHTRIHDGHTRIHEGHTRIHDGHSRIHIQIGDNGTDDIQGNLEEKRDYISPVRMRNKRRFSEVSKQHFDEYGRKDVF